MRKETGRPMKLTLEFPLDRCQSIGYCNRIAIERSQNFWKLSVNSKTLVSKLIAFVEAGISFYGLSIDQFT